MNQEEPTVDPEVQKILGKEKILRIKSKLIHTDETMIVLDNMTYTNEIFGDQDLVNRKELNHEEEINNEKVIGKWSYEYENYKMINLMTKSGERETYIAHRSVWRKALEGYYVGQ